MRVEARPSTRWVCSQRNRNSSRRLSAFMRSRQARQRRSVRRRMRKRDRPTVFGRTMICARSDDAGRFGARAGGRYFNRWRARIRDREPSMRARSGSPLASLAPRERPRKHCQACGSGDACAGASVVLPPPLPLLLGPTMTTCDTCDGGVGVRWRLARHREKHSEDCEGVFHVFASSLQYTACVKFLTFRCPPNDAAF